jgi:hypothetical protein
MLTTFLASSWIDSSAVIPTPTSLTTTTTTTTTATTTTTTTATANTDINTNDDQYQNRMLHYGVYCGPGPADAFSGVPAADSVDRVCQVSE